MCVLTADKLCVIGIISVLELWPLDTITPEFWINTHSVTSPVDEAVHGLNHITVKVKHQSCVHFYQHVCTLLRKGIKDSTPHPTRNSNILPPLPFLCVSMCVCMCA